MANRLCCCKPSESQSARPVNPKICRLNHYAVARYRCEYVSGQMGWTAPNGIDVP
jgi:hypothetical protein